MICRVCHTASDNNNFCLNPACSMNIQCKLTKYIDQFTMSSESFNIIIKKLVLSLKDSQNTIYFTGIGKSSHIVKKIVATWQSFGINSQSVLIQDLSHGDFGIFKNGGTIIYVSNSGNTEELIYVAKYIKVNFSIYQIAITNNPSAILREYVNDTYNICNFKIQEADVLNMAPSISSVLFMSLLDIVGILIAELNCLTKEQFKIYHPGGDIGKII